MLSWVNHVYWYPFFDFFSSNYSHTKNTQKKDSLTVNKNFFPGNTWCVNAVRYVFFLNSLLPKPYPIVKNEINDTYYYTKQEYGMAWTDPGVNITFYKKRRFWSDIEKGNIAMSYYSPTIEIKTKEIVPPTTFEIIVTEKSKIALDTVLDLNKDFDFKYFPK